MPRHPTLLALIPALTLAALLPAACGGGGGGGGPAPAVCGDGLVQAGEACDGAALDGQSCATLGLGFTGGTLACSGSCTFDTAACDRGAARCGDGLLQAGEGCDDGNVAAGDGCSPTCQLEAPNSGWFAPGGVISEGGGP